MNGDEWSSRESLSERLSEHGHSPRKRPIMLVTARGLYNNLLGYGNTIVDSASFRRIPPRLVFPIIPLAPEEKKKLQSWNLLRPSHCRVVEYQYGDTSTELWWSSQLSLLRSTRAGQNWGHPVPTLSERSPDGTEDIPRTIRRAWTACPPYAPRILPPRERCVQ